MTYDFNDRQRASIGAPLFQETNEHFQHKETIDENIQKILNQNCDSSKIIMGISTHAKAYRLKLTSKNYIGAMAVELNDVEGNSVNKGIVEYHKVRFIFEFLTKYFNYLKFF